MKTLIAAATLSLISSLSLAQEPAVQFVREGDGLVPVYMSTSGKSRAEVIAELNASRADAGAARFVFEGDGLVPAYPAISTRTRAEVVAELQASKARMDYVHVGDESVPRDIYLNQFTVADARPVSHLAFNDAGRR
jgi:hypothetical protein